MANRFPELGSGRVQRSAHREVHGSGQARAPLQRPERDAWRSHVVASGSGIDAAFLISAMAVLLALPVSPWLLNGAPQGLAQSVR